jgi:hypothetical protein
VQVLLGRIDSANSAVDELVAGTKGVVVWHRALLYLDWLLGMAGSSALPEKALLLVKFLCYATAVELLSSSIDSYALPAK